MLDAYPKKILIPVLIIAYLWLASIIYSKLMGSLSGSIWLIPLPFETILIFLFDQREFVQKKIGAAHFFSLLPFALLFVGQKKEPELHGSARFAYYHEIVKKYAHTGKGFLLGYLKGKKIIIDGPNHMLIKAETRAGKGVSWVVPLFFSWCGSIITLDIKKENYNLTAGFRKLLGHKIYMLNFMAEDKRTDCFNPFDYMPDDKMNRISFIQKLGHFISPTPPNADPIWTGEARGLFEGLVLMAADLDEFQLSFGQLYRMLNTEEKTHEYLERMIQVNKEKLDPACKMALYSFINTPDKTRGGIKMQLTAVLKPFSNPIIDAATTNSSFDIRDIKSKKMAVYVVVPPKYLTELGMIVNLFFQLAVDLNLDNVIENDKTYKHNCLFLMDEFTSIGYMQTFAKKIEYMLGYGLQLVLIAHSTEQLEGVYGKYQSKNIENNCTIKGYLTPNELVTAQELSNRIGTITTKQKSVNRDHYGWTPKSQSESLTKRPLMLPQEILEMPDDKCLLFLKGIKPIYADRIFYYNDKLFKDNVKTAPSVPLLTFNKTTEIKAKMKTIEIDFADLNSEVDKSHILSDNESIEAANEYLTMIGVI